MISTPWFDGEALFGAVAVRLLTAFAARIVPEITDEASGAWDDALAQGAFDAERVDDYCDTHREAFWLVAPHGCRRFMQESALGSFLHEHADSLSPEELGKRLKPVSDTKLTMHAAPSYAWHNQDVSKPLSFAAAARHLMIFKHYAPCGIPDSRHPGHANGHQWKNGKLRDRVSVHPVGQTLYETLMLHAIPVPVDKSRLHDVGLPAWESREEDHSDSSAQLVPQSTLLGQLTGGFTHTVWLVSDGHAIDRAWCATGRPLAADIVDADPYVVRYEAPPAKDSGSDAPVVKHMPTNPDKSVWRDLSLIAINTGDSDGVSGVTPVISATNSDYNRQACVKTWVLVSHYGDNAKECGWGQARVAPTILSDEPGAHQRWITFLALAEHYGKQVARSAKTFASRVGTGGPTGKGMIKVAEIAYWSAAEAAFGQFMLDKSEDVHEGGDSGEDDIEGHLVSNRLCAIATDAVRRAISVVPDSAAAVRNRGKPNAVVESTAVARAYCLNCIKPPKPTKQKTHSTTEGLQP